jgi:pimeloyl-ACP methyl ester carboxylesterase
MQIEQVHYTFKAHGFGLVARLFVVLFYPKLIYYNKLDKGGHFAAWEEPLLFAAELRAAFRSLRQQSATTSNR